MKRNKIKSQNFYNFLDGYSIDGDNILKYCKEIIVLEENAINYLAEDEKTKKSLNVNMKIFGAKSREELKIKKQQEVDKKKNTIENISKFTSFVEKEGEAYNKILGSKEFARWLDEDAGVVEEFFEYIDCIPAYIYKHSKTLVLDLMGTFRQIMNLIGADIESIINIQFPINGKVEHLASVQRYVKSNKINLDEKTKAELMDLVISYEDFEYLIGVINEEIKELQEPLKN